MIVSYHRFDGSPLLVYEKRPKEKPMDSCPNCGSYDCEQEGSTGEGHLKLTCVACGDVRFLETYRDEGQDKWRDPRDRDDGYRY